MNACSRKSNWQRDQLDPVAYIRDKGWPVDHISYDPRMRKGDYSIIRTSAHDGTLLFTYELIEKALLLLAAKASFDKLREEEFTAQRERVHYTVGPLRLATVFGLVKLPLSETRLYPGQRERVRIPVRMTFVARLASQPDGAP